MKKPHPKTKKRVPPVSLLRPGNEETPPKTKKRVPPVSLLRPGNEETPPEDQKAGAPGLAFETGE